MVFETTASTVPPSRQADMHDTQNKQAPDRQAAPPRKPRHRPKLVCTNSSTQNSTFPRAPSPNADPQAHRTSPNVSKPVLPKACVGKTAKERFAKHRANTQTKTIKPQGTKRAVLPKACVGRTLEERVKTFAKRT